MTGGEKREWDRLQKSQNEGEKREKHFEVRSEGKGACSGERERPSGDC